MSRILKPKLNLFFQENLNTKPNFDMCPRRNDFIGFRSESKGFRSESKGFRGEYNGFRRESKD